MLIIHSRSLNCSLYLREWAGLGSRDRDGESLSRPRTGSATLLGMTGGRSSLTLTGCRANSAIVLLNGDGAFGMNCGWSGFAGERPFREGDWFPNVPGDEAFCGGLRQDAAQDVVDLGQHPPLEAFIEVVGEGREVP